MWAALLSLVAAFLAGLLAGGGPTLWLGLLVGLAVFGGDPGDPLAALLASAVVVLSLTVMRTRSRRRPHGR